MVLKEWVCGPDGISLMTASVTHKGTLALDLDLFIAFLLSLDTELGDVTLETETWSLVDNKPTGVDR